MSLGDLRRMLDEKKLGAVELLDEYLKKIKDEDGEINSFITCLGDEAIASARLAQMLIDKGEAKAMTGIPYAAKDNILTKGVLTTCASRMLCEYIPPYSATVIESLEHQGAVLMGKTNLDEFAMGGSGTSSYFGATKNPKNMNKVAGGSSSGSAAAVCAGFVPVALGTDTGGSVRIPASFCGVVGLKPTYGRVSRYGLVSYASSLDQIGVIANSAEDAGYVLNVIAGHDEMDATSAKAELCDFTDTAKTNIKDLKIGVIKNLMGSQIDEEVKLAVSDAVRLYEKLGAKVIEVEIPSLEYALEAYYIIASAEAASNLARFDGVRYGYAEDGCKSYAEMIAKSRSAGFGQQVKRRILLGNYLLSDKFGADYYKRAVSVKNRLTEELREVFARCDVLISPTAPTAAYGFDECDILKVCKGDVCTVMVNLSGLPAISIPCGVTSAGLPIGMSIIGKHFSEQKIIGVADVFEKEAGK